MLNTNSPLFLVMPGGLTFAVPVGLFIDRLADKKICLNCGHFHQTEDWRDEPEGFYMPRGECRAHAPSSGGFPTLHAGKHCGEFCGRAGEEDRGETSGKPRFSSACGSRRE